MSPALLEVEELHKRFGGVAAVRDASFAVAEGSITALIGPNGAGKTTMFNLVSGFLRADRSTVRFAGHRIERWRADSIARAGLVRGDPDRLQQVVCNLLSNAIKFTGRGGLVEVAHASRDSQVEVAVSDSGQGIAPEFLPYVFDRFRQADGSTTRRHGGLGLGLAIVRQLVELHGGRVRAESPGTSTARKLFST